MEIMRIADADTYEAPGHFNMTAQRLQGKGVTGAESCSVGFSVFQPGGGCENSATPLEKIYFVLSGEITVTVASGKFVLATHDSCRIEPNESRSMLNESGAPTELLVIVPSV